MWIELWSQLKTGQRLGARDAQSSTPQHRQTVPKTVLKLTLILVLALVQVLPQS